MVGLAGDGGEREGGHLGVGGGRRARAARLADPAARPEAVVEDPVGGEVVDLDVHGVVELGVRGGRAASDDPAEAVVVGQLPVHGDAFGGQTAVGLVRGGREPRPQEDGAGQRVARGDAEREGVVGDLRRVEFGGARHARGRQVDGEGERGGRAGGGEEAAAADVAGDGAEFGGVLRRMLVGCGCHLALP